MAEGQCSATEVGEGEVQMRNYLVVVVEPGDSRASEVA